MVTKEILFVSFPSVLKTRCEHKEIIDFSYTIRAYDFSIKVSQPRAIRLVKQMRKDPTPSLFFYYIYVHSITFTLIFGLRLSLKI